MKRDLLHECNRHGLSVEEFQATFCQRCRQRECKRAAWGSGLMETRVAAQEQRLLHPTQVDPSSAKYAHLIDFDDMLERAVQLEVADRRGDWEVPEIPITDGRVEVHAADQVDAAVRRMKTPVEVKPDIVAEDLPDPKTPIVPEEPVPPPQKAARPKAFVPPKVQNAPSSQGVMVGGGPPPTTPEPVDPWAPPPGATPDPGKPKIRKVPVGGTVKMGGGDK